MVGLSEVVQRVKNNLDPAQQMSVTVTTIPHITEASKEVSLESKIPSGNTAVLPHFVARDIFRTLR